MNKPFLRMRALAGIIAALAVCCGIASCAQDDARPASLTVALPGHTARAATTVDDIATYTVSVESRAAAQSATAQPGQTVTFTDLAPGTYTVDVRAFDAEGTCLATGTAEAAVIPGTAAQVSVQLTWRALEPEECETITYTVQFAFQPEYGSTDSKDYTVNEALTRTVELDASLAPSDGDDEDEAEDSFAKALAAALESTDDADWKKEFSTAARTHDMEWPADVTVDREGAAITLYYDLKKPEVRGITVTLSSGSADAADITLTQQENKEAHTVTFTVQGAAADATYTWTLDGEELQNSPSKTYTYDVSNFAPGTYDVCVTVTSGSDEYSAFAQIQVTAE